MRPSSERLTEMMRAKTDEELYLLLYVHSQDYSAEAINAAREEFSRRHLDTPAMSRLAADAGKAQEDTQSKKGKKRIITRKAWTVCSVLSLLAAITNTGRSGAAGLSEAIPFLIGGFIGTLAVSAGIWAIVVLAFRAIFRKRPAM